MTRQAVDLRRGLMVLDDPDTLLGDTLAEFLASPDAMGRVQFVLRVRRGAVPDAPPEGAGAEQSEREGIVLDFWRTTDRRHLLIRGHAALATGLDASSAMTVAPGCGAAARGELAMVALEEALNASGQTLIHCAALRPAGAEGLVLIHAASGTGKTTTALALAGAGFGFAADDAAVIGPDEGGAISAWGLPRALNLHRQSAAMLDWLRPALPDPWPDKEEVSVPQGNLPPPVLQEPRVLPVLALIELRRGGDAGLRPVSAGAALTALMADNIGVTASGLWPVQQGRLDLMVALAGQTPCYELRVGPGAEGLQAAIRTMQSAF